jgi:hypothetical protein
LRRGPWIIRDDLTRQSPRHAEIRQDGLAAELSCAGSHAKPVSGFNEILWHALVLEVKKPQAEGPRASCPNVQIVRRETVNAPTERPEVCWGCKPRITLEAGQSRMKYGDFSS